MLRHPCTCLLAAILCLSPATSGAAPADTAESVKEKLYQAKKEFDDDVQKFKKAAVEWFEKRESSARDSGNTKLLDQNKTERAAFDSTGELPQAAPTSIRDMINVSRHKLDRSYTAAVKSLLVLKEDAVAETTEKERLGVLIEMAIRFGKRTPLSTLKAFDVKTGEEKYGVDTLRTKSGDLFPSSIYLIPPTRGSAQAKYTLSGRWSVLALRVGVPEFKDTARPPDSEVTYEVLGDDVSLWKSKPSNTLNDFQTCDICVQKVKVLTLKVHCPGSAGWCRSWWIEPRLIE